MLQLLEEYKKQKFLILFLCLSIIWVAPLSMSILKLKEHDLARESLEKIINYVGSNSIILTEKDSNFYGLSFPLLTYANIKVLKFNDQNLNEIVTFFCKKNISIYKQISNGEVSNSIDIQYYTILNNPIAAPKESKKKKIKIYFKEICAS